MTSRGTEQGDRLRLALSTALWTGLAPVAPGTFGTLPAVALHAALVASLPPPFVRPALLAAFLCACAASLRLAPWAVAHWKRDDPGNFVLDEVAGYLLVPLLFVPPSAPLPAMAAAFALFRLFDIVKPPPAGAVDRRWKGPWGILLDDLVAAAYAAAGMYLLRFAGIL